MPCGYAYITYKTCRVQTNPPINVYSSCTNPIHTPPQLYYAISHSLSGVREKGRRFYQGRGKEEGRAKARYYIQNLYLFGEIFLVDNTVIEI